MSSGKITFLKGLDSVAGSLAISIARLFLVPKPDVGAVTSILFIRPGGIGDAVLLLPAIDLLKTKFPAATIDILCEKRNAGIFDLSSAIDRIYLYDRGSDLMRCVRNTYDVVVDTEQWHRLSAVVACLTGAPVRIGFDTNDRGKIFSHRISYSHDDYEVRSFLRLLEPLIGRSLERDCDIEAPFVKPQKTAIEKILATEALMPRGLIAMFPGASVEERKWGGKKFGQVAGALGRMGYKVVVLGSRLDRADTDEIIRSSPGTFDLTGKTSLAEVASVLGQCRVLITADSGLMHIAYAVGTPTVSLFGSGIEKKWVPRGGRHIAINKRLECSPCTTFGYTPRCNKGVLCLSLISPEEVICAVERLLADLYQAH